MVAKTTHGSLSRNQRVKIAVLASACFLGACFLMLGVWIGRRGMVAAPQTDSAGSNGGMTREQVAADSSVPQLLAPVADAVMDNGRTDALDDIVWDFSWSDVPGASEYELCVAHTGSQFPFIERQGLADSSFHHVSHGAYISFPTGWTWKVRARVGGTWQDWSEVRPFRVERLNADPPRQP
jgi:hypothetical protein